MAVEKPATGPEVRFDFDVFINYAHEDRNTVQELVYQLKDLGFKVWYDANDLKGGEDWEGKIRQAIRSSRLFIAVFSPNSVKQEEGSYVQREIEIALQVWDRERRSAPVFILPVRLAECRISQPRVKALQWIDLFPDWDLGFRKLAGRLIHLPGRGKDIEIIGFDLGHGESSFAHTYLFSTGEPKEIDILNGKASILTAVAYDRALGWLIGEDAYQAPDPERLEILFKGFNFDDPHVRRPVIDFTKACLERLIRDRKISGGIDSFFFVGCPSGWQKEDRQKYEEVLREAGLQNVQVHPESRSAFLEARESGALKEKSGKLSDSVFIIDIGSSTTDFTIVKNYEETPLDLGHNALGGGLIDELILEHTLKSYGGEAEEFEAFFIETPAARARCLVMCREVKEAYFSKSSEAYWIKQPASASVKLRKRLYFDIELFQKDMQAILAKPIPKLVGKTWPEAFREALFKCLTLPDFAPPDLILMTGGGSRMRFTQEICQEVFPEAELRVGLNPALTIAKGLALIGRIDLKVQSFRQELDDFLSSELFENIVKMELPKLSACITPKFYEIIVQVSKEKMEEWTEGKLSTIAKVEVEIRSGVRKRLQEEAGKILRKEVKNWLEEINPKLEQMTSEICVKYGIPKKGLSFDLRFGQVDNMQFGPLDPKDSVNEAVFELTSQIGRLITQVLVVVSLNMGWLNLPLAIIMAVVLALATIIAGESVKKKVKEIKFPLIVRGRIYKEEKMDKELKNKQPEIEGQIEKSLLKELQKHKIFDQIMESIRTNLHRQADQYSILIRQQS